MSLSDAAALGARLEDHLSAYARGTVGQPPQAKGFARLFRRWFSYNAQDIEPVHKDFLEGTEALVNQLAAAVAELSAEEEDRGKALAEQAVRSLLAEKSEALPNDRRLYLIAAEPLCAPLLPRLDRDALSRRREEMLRITPRRLMVPRQLALLEEMDRLLGE